MFHHSRARLFCTNCDGSLIKVVLFCYLKLIYCVIETLCFLTNVNRPPPYFILLVGHEQEKDEKPWSKASKFARRFLCYLNSGNLRGT